MPKTIQALIIDDEYRARKTLLHMLNAYVSGIEVIGEAADVETGVAAIQKLRPDLVFLDINMPGGTGFDLLEEYVLPPFEVIFTTAIENQAIRAMRLNALDYLIKPVSVDELRAAVDRFNTGALRKREAVSVEDAPAEPNPINFSKVVLPTKEGFLLTDLNDVIHCEAASSYTIFHLSNGRQIVSTRTLKVFEQQFTRFYFQRVHHKELVNLHHVETFNARENFLVMDNGVLVNVSARKKSALIRRLKEV